MSTDRRPRGTAARAGLLVFAVLATASLPLPASRSEAGPVLRPQTQAAPQDTTAPSGGLLRLLGITPSAESVDYVANKTQFQLHTLLTEQRHPKTWDLGDRAARDAAAALRMLFSVDEDVRARLDALAASPETLDKAAAAVEEAIRAGRKIYIYGCGATGRLAKQMESCFWRPFWRAVRADAGLAKKIAGAVPADIGDRLIGEMTGADRALISSLEGFEDLPLIGRLQLRDRGVAKGDVVICVTEGGETSSVIGAILAAHDDWKAAPGYDPAESRKRLYFVYNNPDDRLRPFARSRAVLDEPGITKINLTTGPQAITGSTRMQATTSETYVVGAVLEAAAARLLRGALSAKEAGRLGFPGTPTVAGRLKEFGGLLDSLKAAAPDMAKLTELESAAYAAGRFSTYFAISGLITVFIDGTERSPTFRLYPLDTVKEAARKCWFQVATDAASAEEAWRAFLGRPFRGLDPALYRKPFETEVDDPYLRRAALASLARAGNDQAALYDFSFAAIERPARAPRAGDIGVIVALGPEADASGFASPAFERFATLCAAGGAGLAVIVATDGAAEKSASIKRNLEAVAAKGGGKTPPPVVVALETGGTPDPLGLRRQVAAKMLLNAHSTAVMARLGRVVGNTMTNVSPSNLKLIGRATFLIQSHVNDALARPSGAALYGRRTPITYGEANAVLFDAIAFLKDKQQTGQTAEVALSIIRILESLRRRTGVTDEEAFAVLGGKTLADYLK